MPSFARPLWLLLLPVLLFFLWKYQQRSFAVAGKHRRLFWFMLRGLIVVLLVSALAGAQFATHVQRNQILFLLDVSDSMMPEEREAALQWINQAIRHIRPQDQSGIVSFAANAAVERFPSYPRMLNRLETQLDTSATNFETAGKLAQALFADNFQKNLVIISDGSDNAGEPDTLFQFLKQQGISLQSHYMEPSPHPEAGMISVRVPEQIAKDQVFPVEVVSTSNQNNSAILQIYRNGILLQEGTLSLIKNESRWYEFHKKFRHPDSIDIRL
jgi:hypothetical protein